MARTKAQRGQRAGPRRVAKALVHPVAGADADAVAAPAPVGDGDGSDAAGEGSDSVIENVSEDESEGGLAIEDEHQAALREEDRHRRAERRRAGGGGSEDVDISHIVQDARGYLFRPDSPLPIGRLAGQRLNDPNASGHVQCNCKGHKKCSKWVMLKNVRSTDALKRWVACQGKFPNGDQHLKVFNRMVLGQPAL